jgi:ATP-dependent RNA helicase DDX47/RRP3
MTAFSELGLSKPVCDAVATLNWIRPTLIQERTIPRAVLGEDVAGMAETGSGKTGAYLLPIIDRFIKANRPSKYAVILTPSRELVLQVADVLKELCKDLDVRISVAYGGVDDVEQMAELAKDPHLIIGTPGRMSQLLQEARGFTIKSVKVVVVDEADKMAGISFYDDISIILSKCSHDRQLLLFSATMPSDIERLAMLSVKKSSFVKLGVRESIPSSLEECMISVRSERKYAVLMSVLSEYCTSQIFIFTNTVRSAIILTDTLKSLKFSVGCAHGRMEQALREQQISLFRSSEVRILVSTGVASRGLDLPNTDIVINFDVPELAKEYVHRSGRAGRAGRRGLAIILVNQEDLENFLKLERFLKRKLQQKAVDEQVAESWTPRVEEARETAVEKYKSESRKLNKRTS